MNEIKEIDKFQDLLSSITEEHIETCDCMNDRVKEVYHVLNKADEKQQKEEGLELNLMQRRHRAQMMYNQALRDVSRESLQAGVKCKYEIEMVKQELKFFIDKYDLNDVRVYIIVKSVIELGLSVLRLSKHSLTHGAVQSVEDREGNTTFKLNPVEEVKIKYHSARINAIKELNNIIEGQKHIHGHFDMNEILEAKDIFGEIEDDKKLVDL